MSNIFKTNSRFDSLSESISSLKKDKKNTQSSVRFPEETNSFKRNDENNRRNPISNNYRREQIDRRALEEKKKKDEEEKKKKEKEAADLDPINFPDLISNKKQDLKTSNNSTSFLEKLKKQVVQKENFENGEDLDFKNLKPGWLLIKKDPLTSKLIHMKKDSLESKNIKKNEDSEIDVLNALVELHKRRTDEYIKLWGYDEWEKMFRIPNYDYEYFDKLDELYEEEMAEYNSEEGDNSDYADEQDNYWQNY